MAVVVVVGVHHFWGMVRVMKVMSVMRVVGREW